MAEEKKQTHKQAAPERKELPASQRKHAARLSDRAQNERVSRPTHTGRNSSTSSRPTTTTNSAPKKAVVLPSMPASSQMGNSPKTSKPQRHTTPRKPTNAAANKQRGGNNHSNATAANNGAGRFGGALASGNNSARNNTRKRQQAQGSTPAGGPVRGARRTNEPRGSKKAQRIAAKQKQSTAPVTQRKEQPLPTVLEYRQGMNVQDLSKLLHRDTAEILKKLFLLGVVVNQNQSLDNDVIELLAVDYGIEAQQKEEVDVADIDKFFEDDTIDEADATPRPPIVTIMGHVDHGKTTLLDYLRKTHVTAGEAGGITQHIGAYQAKLNDKLITFLDTPGHAAFSEMRARGANITDIIVLVVAADDGIMPQTIEAINHAKAAATPIIVAINKMDIPGADANPIINELMSYELVPEEYGGDTIMVPLSAKTGDNVEKLLEMILLQAEVLDLKADAKVNGRGTVVEARLDKGRGPVATLLVQQGSVHTGDPIVVGNTFGRVRTMNNENVQAVETATPATPIEITGLNDVPQAGDRFIVMNSEKEAREAGEERAERALEVERQSGSTVTLDNLFSTMADKEMKTVPVIVKADVQGSAEALASSLRKIEVDEVRVDIIHAGVGAINETDITLAEASNALVVGFNVRPTAQARKQADQSGVEINLYNVIYNVIDDVEAAMKGQLEPTFTEKILGQVEVRELFHFSKIGTIAGGMVTEGKIARDNKVRLIRDGVVVYDGELGSLRREKDDAKEVAKGYELGLTIANFNDVKVGDVVEAYMMEEVPVK